ncbi:MAG: hypothetical protein E6Q95_03770, partial [Chitinophagaceae bacterium]
DFRRDAGGNAIAPNNSSDFTTTASYTSSGKKLTMAIPFGIGLKYKFNYNWALFGEFMFRPIPNGIAIVSFFPDEVYEAVVVKSEELFGAIAFPPASLRKSFSIVICGVFTSKPPKPPNT